MRGSASLEANPNGAPAQGKDSGMTPACLFPAFGRACCLLAGAPLETFLLVNNVRRRSLQTVKGYKWCVRVQAHRTRRGREVRGLRKEQGVPAFGAQKRGGGRLGSVPRSGATVRPPATCWPPCNAVSMGGMCERGVGAWVQGAGCGGSRLLQRSGFAGLSAAGTNARSAAARGPPRFSHF